MIDQKQGEVPLTGGSWFGLDALDRQLFTQLAEVGATFDEHAGKIWGLGFRPDRMPLLAVRNSGTLDAYGYAVNVTELTGLGDMVQLVPLPEWLGLPPIYRFGYELASRLELSAQDPAQFACEIGNQECLAVVYDQDEAHASSWEFSRFLVHEAFHQYQMFEQCWRVPTGYDPASPWVADAIDAELATRETWYLEAAVMQPAGNGARDLARSFLDVRAKRHARRADLLSLEQGHEQIEGSARYVENLYASLNGRPFRLPLPTVNEVDYQEFSNIGRYYRTGARVMELLDRSGTPWRHRMADGTDPVSLLAEILESDTSFGIEQPISAVATPFAA